MAEQKFQPYNAANPTHPAFRSLADLREWFLRPHTYAEPMAPYQPPRGPMVSGPITRPQPQALIPVEREPAMQAELVRLRRLIEIMRRQGANRGY